MSPLLSPSIKSYRARESAGDTIRNRLSSLCPQTKAFLGEGIYSPLENARHPEGW